MKPHPARTLAVILALNLVVLAGLLPALESGRADGRARAAGAKKKHHVYCSARRHPKGCVKVPKPALRPPHVNQQGPNSLTPAEVETGGGLGGGPGDHGAVAQQWARSQLGLSRWAWRCERFVEEAYGTRSKFATAAKASGSLQLTRSPVATAPVGSLVYFAPDSANRHYGHVGLSLGKGKVISALDTVRITNVSHSKYWRGLYVGWAAAPAHWPGRIPPPPGATTADPTLGVRITAPAQGSTQSGTVALLATASGVTGVEFDAYYAANPRDPASRGWHTLGAARHNADGSWQLDWITAGVPDQGFADWGTINIAAIAMDASDRRTGTRDYRRVAVDNTTGSTGPPATATTPPGGAPAPQTYPETTGGVANTWSDYYSAGGTAGRQIESNRTVQVSCKVQGYQVPDGNTWWYRLAESPWNNGFYATADAFYNNGQTTGSLIGTPFFDPNVPICP
jgi:hypothetical protein